MNCENKSHTCCFFGHRKIDETDELKSRLYYEVEKLITNQKVDTFLFGSRSQFDDLCYEIVSVIKGKYPHIKRVYVRAEFAYISDDYKNYLLERYEDTYYPEKMHGAGKGAYVERNCEMIDKSSYCICYRDENYNPPGRKNSRRDLIEYQPKSGTTIAYNYAIANKKKIINVI